MSDPLVSIVIRSFNEGWALSETLAAIRRQEYRSWELLAFDSGSTDGSIETLKNFGPKHLIVSTPKEYNPSRVINHGMRLAESDYVVFLNADATPVGENWLRPLASALFSPDHAAVFGRQIPRPDCRAVFACDYDRCFGPDRESARWDHFFSMVSSGIRKDIWRRRGFLEKLQYAEDDEYTRWCLSQGYKVSYCPESVVIHSHNYTPAQAYKRSFGDARALAASWRDDPTHFNFARTVLLGTLSDLRHDLRFCWRHRRLGEFPHAARIRWNQRRGRLAGFWQGWRDYRAPRPKVKDEWVMAGG